VVLASESPRARVAVGLACAPVEARAGVGAAAGGGWWLRVRSGMITSGSRT